MNWQQVVERIPLRAQKKRPPGRVRFPAVAAVLGAGGRTGRTGRTFTGAWAHARLLDETSGFLKGTPRPPLLQGSVAFCSPAKSLTFSGFVRKTH